MGAAGAGKTTIARLVAARTRKAFEPLSAVSAGVKEVREVTGAGPGTARGRGQGTILFLDEVHRFNRTQQDALLPHVEEGLLVLIGATTENPFFSLTGPLLSRSTLFRLEPLSADALRTLATRAMTDPRGLGDEPRTLDDDALEHLVSRADGDARHVLTSLDVAAALAAESGRVEITLADVEAAMALRALRYGDDEHYDILSAFIKSIRGSDADAGLYWLARMLEAGEDARLIARRLVILASEDVGLADPRGLLVADAAAHRGRVRRAPRSPPEPRAGGPLPRTGPEVELGAHRVGRRARRRPGQRRRPGPRAPPRRSLPWRRPARSRGRVPVPARRTGRVGRPGLPAGRDGHAPLLPGERTRRRRGPGPERRRRPGSRGRGGTTVSTLGWVTLTVLAAVTVAARGRVGPHAGPAPRRHRTGRHARRPARRVGRDRRAGGPHRTGRRGVGPPSEPGRPGPATPGGARTGDRTDREGGGVGGRGTPGRDPPHRGRPERALVIRRGFWLAAGFGLGVAAATEVRRRVDAAVARLAPSSVATRLRRDLTGALDDGRREMRAREARLRHVLAAPGALDSEGLDDFGQ